MERLGNWARKKWFKAVFAGFAIGTAITGYALAKNRWGRRGKTAAGGDGNADTTRKEV